MVYNTSLQKPHAADGVLHLLGADIILQSLTTLTEHAAWAAAVLDTREEWELSPELTAALQVLEGSHMLEGSQLTAVKQCFRDWLVSGPAVPVCSRYVCNCHLKMACSIQMQPASTYTWLHMQLLSTSLTRLVTIRW